MSGTEKTIGELDTVTAVAAGDWLAVEDVSDSRTYKVSASDVASLGGGGGSALEVQSAGVLVDDAVEILDFSAEFTLAESPTHDIDVSINSITASKVSDFDTEVSNNTDVAANTAARHDAVTVTDSSEIDFTLTGQNITASVVAGSIDETKLDISTNASLDLADSALQGNETITLSGDVIGSGTTAITTTIPAGSIDEAQLDTSVNASLDLADSSLQSASTLTAVLTAGNTTSGQNIQMTTTDKLEFRDVSNHMSSDVSTQISIITNGQIRMGSATNYLQVDSTGKATFTGTGVLAIATNFQAFQSAAAALAGHAFEASGGNGFPHTDTGGNRISKVFLGSGANGGNGGVWSKAGFAQEEITPTQITSNQNNYAGLKDNGFALLTSNGSYNITGFARPNVTNIKSRMGDVYNDNTSGSGRVLTFTDQDASSNALNQLFNVTTPGASMVLQPGEGLRYQYSPSKNVFFIEKK